MLLSSLETKLLSTNLVFVGAVILLGIFDLTFDVTFE